MRRFVITISALALVLAGCASDGAGRAATTETPPTSDSARPPNSTVASKTTSPTTTSPTTTSPTTTSSSTTTTPSTTTTQPPTPRLDASCTSQEGFSVSYPGDWATNDGSVVSACTMFDPNAFTVPAATDERVAAITLYVEQVRFDTATSTDPAFERSRRTLTVDGLPAVRIEREVGDDGLIPTGTLVTSYFVDLPLPGETLIANTLDYRSIDYPEATRVLDRMVPTLDISIGNTGAVEPIGEFVRPPVTSERFPAPGDPALLADVRYGTHDGFRRVVFEFHRRADFSYSVEYVERAVPPSGDPLDVAGDAILQVTMTPASAVDLTGAQPRETYDGPERFDLPGDPIAQLVEVEDFENTLTWAIGLSLRSQVAVATLNDPVRLVIDISAR